MEKGKKRRIAAPGRLKRTLNKPKTLEAKEDELIKNYFRIGTDISRIETDSFRLDSETLINSQLPVIEE